MTELYAILDWPHAGGLDAVAAAQGLIGDKPAGSGPRYLQLRCKDAPTARRIALIDAVAPVCQASGVGLIVNDDVEAALARPSLVAGVHLGQRDLERLGPPSRWAEQLAALRSRRATRVSDEKFVLGISTHNLEQVRASGHLPVDYIGFGPVQATRSKALPEPVVGFEGLAAACETSRHPVVAIGGLDAAGAVRAASAGAAMVAVIGALVADNIAEVRARVVALATALAAN